MPALHRPWSPALLFDRPASGCGWQNLRGCLRALAVRTVAQGTLGARFEERRRERERIARELHDTLLQGAQALILSVQALAARMPADDPMHTTLADTLERAQGLLVQGLDRIQDLRAAGHASVDLVKSLSSAWSDLGRRGPLRILVEGSPRELESRAGDEIALIGREALSNALRHARASSIEAQIVHDSGRLLMRIRDDGVGMGVGNGNGALAAGARACHWGLQGMRERALSIGGRLEVWSAPGAGTEIELMVPAAVAYPTRHPRAPGR